MGGEAFGVAGVAAVAVFSAGLEGFAERGEVGADGFGGGAEFIERGGGFEDGLGLGFEGFEDGSQRFEGGGFCGLGVRPSDGICGGDLNGRAGIAEQGG